MRTKLAGIAILLSAFAPAPAPAAEGVPVPASEVRSWAENGTLWCMNPTEAGTCEGLIALWQPARSGGYEFVAAETVDAAGGLFTVTQPFTIEGDRQCYTVDPATVRFGTLGDPKGPLLEDARRRWLIGLRNEAGKQFCMAFSRDPDTGLVRRRQWMDGVAIENQVEEVWQVTFREPDAPKIRSENAEPSNAAWRS